VPRLFEVAVAVGVFPVFDRPWAVAVIPPLLALTLLYWFDPLVAVVMSLAPDVKVHVVAADAEPMKAKVPI
jgi:hypothetical protein